MQFYHSHPQYDPPLGLQHRQICSDQVQFLIPIDILFIEILLSLLPFFHLDLFSPHFNNLTPGRFSYHFEILFMFMLRRYFCGIGKSRWHLRHSNKCTSAYLSTSCSHWVIRFDRGENGLVMKRGIESGRLKWSCILHGLFVQLDEVLCVCSIVTSILEQVLVQILLQVVQHISLHLLHAHDKLAACHLPWEWF